nr:immunoglobulin heavy chain junction region [Mus musculus]
CARGDGYSDYYAMDCW